MKAKNTGGVRGADEFDVAVHEGEVSAAAVEGVVADLRGPGVLVAPGDVMHRVPIRPPGKGGVPFKARIGGQRGSRPVADFIQGIRSPVHGQEAVVGEGGLPLMEVAPVGGNAVNATQHRETIGRRIGRSRIVNVGDLAAWGMNHREVTASRGAEESPLLVVRLGLVDLFQAAHGLKEAHPADESVVDWIIATDDREGVAVLSGIETYADGDLAEIARASGRVRGLAGASERGEEQRGEDGNNRHDD